MKRQKNFSSMTGICIFVIAVMLPLTVVFAQDTGRITGTVVETFDVPGYTYAQVDTGKEKIWAAGPVTPLKVGDKIGFSTFMPMRDFHSKAVKRDFKLIYFSGRFYSANEADKHAGQIAAPHGNVSKADSRKPVEGIEKISGGYSIAELIAQRQELKGKTIRVRGKVSKFTGNVMGKDWFHIRDSSTLDDLTVTRTSIEGSKTQIGDVVIVKGKLGVDRDFSYGYVYPVILEGASVAKE